MSGSRLPDAWGVLPAAWRGICREMGQSPFRADQIVTGLFQNGVDTWQAFTTLPVALRVALTERFWLAPLDVMDLQDASDGVRKLLLGCADGERIETVLIPSKGRVTQCISSQVGCDFRCAFCASGQKGCARDLTAGEMVGQVMAGCALMRQASALEDTRPRPGAKPMLPRPGNLVVMGMGEPFDNYDQVLLAMRILNDPKGLNIGARHITISSCGVVPGIRRLAEEGVQFELSISLHAPDDALRTRLMPVNKRWPIADVIATCAAYTARTGRVVTFEYTLIKNVNDQPRHAAALIRLLRALPCKVNLIPLSPVEGFDGERPSHASCLAFLDALLKARIPATMRQSRGRDVNAACGQLRLRHG